MIAYLKLFALFNILNGLVMIVAPEFWYQQTPGASATGPFNIHFVRDIGIAFLAAGSGLALGVSQKKLTANDIAFVSMVFLAGHGLLHLFEMIAMGALLNAAMRDFVLIVLPVLIAIFCLMKLERGNHTGHHKHQHSTLSSQSGQRRNSNE